MLDRGFASLALVVAGPIIGGLAVLVRQRDGAPAVIGLQRVGESGRPFRLWKLRTMRSSGPNAVAAGSSITGADDTRVTDIGRTLRARRLDELPQLWNVVRGEMALIGPRPEAPEFVDTGDARWQAVLATPPGVTGATQLIVREWEAEVVSGSGGIERYATHVLPVKLHIDQWYVANATPIVDARIAWETLRFAFGRGPGSALSWLQNRIGMPGDFRIGATVHRLEDSAGPSQGE